MSAGGLGRGCSSTAPAPPPMAMRMRPWLPLRARPSHLPRPALPSLPLPCVALPTTTVTRHHRCTPPPRRSLPGCARWSPEAWPSAPRCWSRCPHATTAQKCVLPWLGCGLPVDGEQAAAWLTRRDLCLVTTQSPLPAQSHFRCQQQQHQQHTRPFIVPIHSLPLQLDALNQGLNILQSVQVGRGLRALAPSAGPACLPAASQRGRLPASALPLPWPACSLCSCPPTMPLPFPPPSPCPPLQLPFAVIPLLILTSDPDIMGPQFVNSRATAGEGGAQLPRQVNAGYTKLYTPSWEPHAPHTRRAHSVSDSRATAGALWGRGTSGVSGCAAVEQKEGLISAGVMLAQRTPPPPPPPPLLPPPAALCWTIAAAIIGINASTAFEALVPYMTASTTWWLHSGEWQHSQVPLGALAWQRCVPFCGVMGV